MARMKTFFIYLLLFIAFFIVSRVLEEGLITGMYKDMEGDVDDSFWVENVSTDIEIKVSDAQKTNRNGYIILDITNNSNRTINESYIKVDFYTKNNNNLAMTKYMEVDDLTPNTTREYTLKFSGSYIDKYKISMSNDYPNKEYIINVLGYDINTKDVLGVDISEYVNASNFRSIGGFINDTFIEGFPARIRWIPWWAWGMAWIIVLCI